MDFGSDAETKFYVVLLRLASHCLALSFILLVNACDTLFIFILQRSFSEPKHILPYHAHVPGGDASRAADVVSSPQKKDHVKTSCPYCLAALPALRVEV